MRLLDKKEVCARLGIGLSTLNYKIDPKSRWYDPDFPEKVMVGRSVRFSEEKLRAWIARRSGEVSGETVARTESAADEPAPNRSEVRKSMQVVQSSEVRLESGRMRRPGTKKATSLENPVRASAPAVPHQSVALFADTPVDVQASAIQEIYVEEPPQLSMYDYIRDRFEQNAPKPPSNLPSTYNAMFRRCAGLGLTVTQSAAFSQDEIASLLSPSEEISSMLDAIDLHSHARDGVFLTAVIYDDVSQCQRLARLARSLGMSTTLEELLRLHRERLFLLYEPEEAKRNGSEPRWCQIDGRWQIRRTPA